MRLFYPLAVVIALAFASSAPAAEAKDLLRAHVPFAFVVAGQDFAPGDYIIHQSDGGVVWVQGAGKAAVALSYPSGSASTGSVSGLRFMKSGQKEYLVGVQYRELSRSIPIPTSDQRKLILAHQ